MSPRAQIRIALAAAQEAVLLGRISHVTSTKERRGTLRLPHMPQATDRR